MNQETHLERVCFCVFLGYVISFNIYSFVSLFLFLVFLFPSFPPFPFSPFFAFLSGLGSHFLEPEFFATTKEGKNNKRKGEEGKEGKQGMASIKAEKARLVCPTSINQQNIRS